MKKIFLLIILFSCFEGYSQITLDFTTSNINLTPVKLSSTLTKYYDQPFWTKVNHFSLDNLDGSLYKTIQMPPNPDTSCIIEIVGFVTTSLFDNDPSTIEYIVHYDFCDSTVSGSPWMVRVIRENGTILLDEPYASYNDLQVYNTEQGAKLMLLYYDGSSNPYEKRIFSLPGSLPSNVDNNLAGSLKPSLYPNPNNGTFFINVSSRTGETGTIDLYTVTGKLIGTYKSDGKVTQISEPGLSNGVYIINAKTSQGFQRAKMIIQK